MVQPKLQILIFNESGNPVPVYKTAQAAGCDLQAFIPETVVIKPGERALIPTGIHVEIPVGYEGQVRARSGLGLKKGITVVNGVGTIDSDYRGDVGAILLNTSKEDFVVEPGDRVAQLVIAPVIQADFIEVGSLEELSSTDRGEGGYGHTGTK